MCSNRKRPDPRESVGKHLNHHGYPNDTRLTKHNIDCPYSFNVTKNHLAFKSILKIRKRYFLTIRYAYYFQPRMQSSLFFYKNTIWIYLPQRMKQHTQLIHDTFKDRYNGERYLLGHTGLKFSRMAKSFFFRSN